jgi:hypothetical protein
MVLLFQLSGVTSQIPKSMTRTYKKEGTDVRIYSKLQSYLYRSNF